MPNQNRARIISGLFFSSLPYRRKFLNFIKEKNYKILISEEPWEDNQNLLKYFFKKNLLFYLRKKTLEYYKEQSFLFDSIILWNDPQYPELLKQIYDPPLVLFCKSSIESEINFNQYDFISIVGTRKPYPISLQAIDRILEIFSISKNTENLIHNIGVVNQHNGQLFPTIIEKFKKKYKNFLEIATISGFAKGIDFRVHQSSMFFNIPTIAVLGSGIDFISPRSNYFLFEEAKRSKKVFIFLSEFFPTYKAGKYTFPLRNRIIVGMSPYLFLIQAGKKSGALISVDYALQENREIFVFDHPLFQQVGGNEGSQNILEQGANRICIDL